MGLWLLFLLALQLSQSESVPPPLPANASDLEVAMEELRERSYDGFVMILKMDQSNILSIQSEVTFLVPTDKVLSQHTISPADVKHFVLSHLIQTPLSFKNMLSFPTGTQIPSGLPNQMFTITNRGGLNFSINNAKVVAPNICKSSSIKCHAIDAIIHFDHHKLLPPPPTPVSPPSPLLPYFRTTISGESSIRESAPSSNRLGVSPETSLNEKSSSGVDSAARGINFHLVPLMFSLLLASLLRGH